MARLSWIIVLGLVVVLGLTGRADACCAAPQPEHAQLVTPPLTRLPPGSGFVIRGSAAVSTSVTLTGPGTVVLVGSELAPNLLRFVLPASLAPGRYGVSATYRGVLGSIGELEIAADAPALAAPQTAPGGVLAHTESPGRWAPNEAVTLTLSSPVSRAVAVAFEWTVAGDHFGSAAWVNAQSTQAALGGTGHCGGYPYGVTLPGHGARVRAAFVDEQGQRGPWSTLTVR